MNTQLATWLILVLVFFVWFGNVSVMTAGQHEHAPKASIAKHSD